MRFERMVRFLSILAGKTRTRLWLCVVAAASILPMVGCANVDLRGESFPDEPLSEMVQRLRKVDDRAESFAFSNKARQIEGDLGVR